MRTVRVQQTFAASLPDAEPDPPGVRVELSLAYEIRRRSPLTLVIDVPFIRRAMTTSLQQTLSRFGASLEPAHPPPP